MSPCVHSFLHVFEPQNSQETQNKVLLGSAFQERLLNQNRKRAETGPINPPQDVPKNFLPPATLEELPRESENRSVAKGIYILKILLSRLKTLPFDSFHHSYSALL